MSDSEFAEYIRACLPDYEDSINPNDNTYMITNNTDNLVGCCMFYKSSYQCYYAIMVGFRPTDERPKFSMFRIDEPEPAPQSDVIYNIMARYIGWLDDNCDFEQFRASHNAKFNLMMNVFVNFINKIESSCAYATQMFRSMR